MMMTKNNILAEAAEEVIGKTVVPEENLPSILKKSLENTWTRVVYKSVT